MVDLSFLWGLLPFFVHGYETAGALHREGRHFLREHVTATYPHNPGLQFSNIIKTLSVAVQTARAKCVIIAIDRLTLDTAPLVLFINGPLPVPSPVSINLPIVHYDALTPPLAPNARFPLSSTSLRSLPRHPLPPFPLKHLPCTYGKYHSVIPVFSYVKNF